MGASLAIAIISAIVTGITQPKSPTSDIPKPEKAKTELVIERLPAAGDKRIVIGESTKAEVFAILGQPEDVVRHDGYAQVFYIGKMCLYEGSHCYVSIDMKTGKVTDQNWIKSQFLAF